MTGLKKKLAVSAETKRHLVEPDNPHLSVRRQCNLLGLPRSTWFYEPATESQANLRLMRFIDRQYTKTPFFGSRKLVHQLASIGVNVNRKRIQRLMQIMGLEALYAKPKPHGRTTHHPAYPYLLRDVSVDKPNQVWSTDITFVPMSKGFMYLVAIIDWFSRYVLSWRISNTIDSSFCIDALKAALRSGRPQIFNTDQGAQFTSPSFTSVLEGHQIQISMDGRGRALDNIFVERLWRTIKYEDIYLHEYETGPQFYTGMCRYMPFYNDDRPHQALNYQTPRMVHFGKRRG